MAPVMSFAPTAMVTNQGWEKPQLRPLTGITVVVLLHAALLWMFTAPIATPVTHDDRVWVQLLQVKPQQALSRPTQAIAPSLFPPVAGTSTPGAARTSPDKDRQAPAPARPATATPPEPAPHASPDDGAPSAHNDEGLASPDFASGAGMPATGLPADVVQQALKSAGAIDRQLRDGQPQTLHAPAESPNARLSRGIAAAQAAVKPKWYEKARTELISASNDPRRIYRVTTGMGEYCLYYPDKASISANSDPRSGAASFGQPTAASCPTAF